jgi:aspartate beta-hydroxylase
MIRDHLRRLVVEMEAELGPGPLQRLAIATRDPATLERAALQDPSSLYVPGLTARPWHDPASFAEVGILERNASVFRQDLQQLLDRRQGFQPFDEGEGGFQPVHTNAGWNVFYFRWACADLPTNQVLCPGSSEVLRTLPGLAQMAFFSALTPGTHLVPHEGLTNAVLTIHLGLVIPSDCEIRVGDETRSWREGKCLVLDDSFEHEVWHKGNATRFILLLDVWHPDLTPLERSCISRAVQLQERQGSGAAPERHRGQLDGKRWW